MKNSPQFAINIKFSVMLFLLGLIFGGLIGWVISLYFFKINIAYEKSVRDVEISASRPKVFVELEDKDSKVVVVIKTPGNKEFINDLNISFVIQGTSTSIVPRSNIIDGEECEAKPEPYLVVNGVSKYDKIIIKCAKSGPHLLNGKIVYYSRSNDTLILPTTAHIKYYWNYKGETMLESFDQPIKNEAMLKPR